MKFYQPTQIVPAILLVIFSVLSSSCEKKKQEETPAIPDRPVEVLPVVARRGADAPLQVKATIRDDGILLAIANIPPLTTLECTIGTTPINPCHDGALVARPAPGDYEINVVAKKNGATVVAGKTKITIMPTSAAPMNDPSTLATQPLALIVDDPSFSNGMAIKRSADFVAKFKFIIRPDCDATVRCSVDSQNNALWPLCDTPTTKLIRKDTMASGLQYLSIQATCADKVGPKLTLFWYGVPENYQPLMIQSIKDSNNRHIFNLVRSEDCATSQLKFQCAAAGIDAFTACEQGNVHNNPPKGFKVRATCGDRVGQVLVIE